MSSPTRRAVLFAVIAGLNAVIAVWLTAMFAMLRHAEYRRNAWLSAALALGCGLAARLALRPLPVGPKAVIAGGSLVLAAAGAWAIYLDLQPGASFEGFILLVGAGWVAQGLAAVPAMRTRWRPSASRRRLP